METYCRAKNIAMCGFVHIYFLVHSLNINKNKNTNIEIVINAVSRQDNRYRGETYQLCQNEQQLCINIYIYKLTIYTRFSKQRSLKRDMIEIPSIKKHTFYNKVGI